MIKLLKTFGKGLLYVIGFPFFIVALLVFAVIGVFLFLYQIAKSVIDFFTGRKFFPELPEDRELRMKKEDAEAVLEAQNQSAEQPSDDIIIPLTEEEQVAIEEPAQEEALEETTVEEACFLETPEEEKVEEEPEPEIEEEDPFKDLLMNEPLQNEEPEDTIEIVEEEKPTPKDVSFVDEDLEEYVPGGSSYSEDIEDEDDDTKGGVSIDFDL